MQKKIMVVGSGVVGKATGKGLIKKGFDVLFVDTDPETVDSLKRTGFSAYFPYELDNIYADISMFSLPTPSKHDGSVDLTYMTTAITNHAVWMKINNINNSNNFKDKYHTVVIRSTVPPGTTEEILIPILERFSGLRVGKDFGLCMQPEFLRAVSSEEDYLKPWLTVIGEYNKQSGDIVEEIYKDFAAPLIRTNINLAEYMKYVHNCFNALKISFSNEIWLLGQRLGIDANKALEMAAKSAEGYWNPNYGIFGGMPYGGACLPKDTRGLLSYANEKGFDMKLLEAAIMVNSQMEQLTKEGISKAPAVIKPPKGLPVVLKMPAKVRAEKIS